MAAAAARMHYRTGRQDSRLSSDRLPKPRARTHARVVHELALIPSLPPRRSKHPSFPPALSPESNPASLPSSTPCPIALHHPGSDSSWMDPLTPQSY
ncbi:hypothetical protein FKP32DRAFT_1590409 [Trametes sanguinea]|nr:hypothetical protein FKP32DRAFT_1590409 [Trametes sanguinea]